MSLVERFAKPAPTAAVGANPNLAQLMQGTANTCAPAGCDSAPPVGVGMVLRATPQGAPLPYPFLVPAAGALGGPGGVAYLTVALDVDFKGDDLMLDSATLLDGTGLAIGTAQTGLTALQVTSWTSNGIRDQNLLAATGLPAQAFAQTSQRRFGFDTAPTQARQQIVVEITNRAMVPVGVSGMIAGVCGDCNTTKRGQ
jgi:hypothetical protein